MTTGLGSFPSPTQEGVLEMTATTTRKFHYTNIDNAMHVLCMLFASDIEQPWTGVDQDGDSYGTIADIAAAISQPASVASVLNDLCDLMGKEPPHSVVWALGGPDAPASCRRCGFAMPVKKFHGSYCIACWRAMGAEVDEVTGEWAPIAR